MYQKTDDNSQGFLLFVDGELGKVR